MKIYIQYIIMAAVAIAFNYTALSGLGQPIVPIHHREFLTNWFTGNTTDWIGFAIFNAMLVIWLIKIITKKSFLHNEVGSNNWNYIFFAAAVGAVLLIYLL